MKLYDACQIIILSQSVHSVVKIGDTYYTRILIEIINIKIEIICGRLTYDVASVELTGHDFKLKDLITVSYPM